MNASTLALREPIAVSTIARLESFGKGSSFARPANGGARQVRSRVGSFAVKSESLGNSCADPGIFAAPVTGSRQGRTVLVQLRDATDPETGHRYTVKRYESEKLRQGDSWQHIRVTLKPINPEYRPIIIEKVEDDCLLVIAELGEVLGPNAPLRSQR
jgi:hypothetical protein